MKNQLKKIYVGLGSAGLLVTCLFFAKPTEISAAAINNAAYLTEMEGECTGPKNENCASENTNACSDLTNCNSTHPPKKEIEP